MNPVLIAERVSAGYGQVTVLHDLSFAVRPGQMVAVTGASGAGKTTLLWTLAGLLEPLQGQVRLGSPTDRITLIPQHNGLASILTAAENIEVALAANGVRAADARRATADMLATVGLTGQAEQLVEELSGGQQQRTAIARGLALRADVLLADEVTSELDAGNRQLVLKLLRAEADRGAAVILATHDPEAAAVCDQALHLPR